ncbi:outer membrane beta-barrel protein [Paludibaculum fermentans]|uniref:Outer membrane beta-barrel protein n=1 Tax=Paludibaculum fermentans TaxID=1473598 RepID=A0A7S7NX66_PALFE|nr:outer membrane beta-barrel protein [Paludibaculum fermentans]QOY91391.1 outer membrane beta-barrel protein [Paludibaculum fermentans]
MKSLKYNSVRGPVLALSLALCLANSAAADETDQQPAKAEPAKPAEGTEKSKAPVKSKSGLQAADGSYVRRFSVGGSISVIGFPVVPAKTKDVTINTGLSVNSKTDTTNKRVGGGVDFQATLTNRFAINVGVMMRRVRFATTDTTYYGVDDTTTTTDERTKMIVERGTRATILDYPVLLRYYTKNHRTAGRRWFYEAGGAFRQITGIHSIGQTTQTDSTVDCCDEQPLKPTNRIIPGYVVGAGLQMIDEFGIRFVPEIRYTRWARRTFDTQSTRMQTNQVEFVLSLTF